MLISSLPILSYYNTSLTYDYSRWYDYYTPQYWSNLLEKFLEDPKGGDVSSLNPPSPKPRL